MKTCLVGFLALAARGKMDAGVASGLLHLAAINCSVTSRSLPLQAAASKRPAAPRGCGGSQRRLTPFFLGLLGATLIAAHSPAQDLKLSEAAKAKAGLVKVIRVAVEESYGEARKVHFSADQWKTFLRLSGFTLAEEGPQQPDAVLRIKITGKPLGQRYQSQKSIVPGALPTGQTYFLYAGAEVKCSLSLELSSVTVYVKNVSRKEKLPAQVLSLNQDTEPSNKTPDDAPFWQAFTSEDQRELYLDSAEDIWGKDRIVRSLIASLAVGSGSPSVTRSDAARYLARIGDPIAVGPLIEALTDKDFGHRHAVSRALYDITGKQLGDDPTKWRTWWEHEYSKERSALVQSLKSEDPRVRLSAVSDLGGSKDITAVEYLMTALQDASVEVRRSAAGGLERKKDARAVDSLILALRDEDSHVRNFAAQALGATGDPRSIDPLIVLLKDKDGSVRFQAKRALERITGEDLGESPSDWRAWLKHGRTP